MKMLNVYFTLFLAAFLQIVINGIAGKPVLVLLPLVYAGYTSFSAPVLVRAVAGLLLLSHAVLYDQFGVLLLSMVMILFVFCGYLDTLLRNDKWVRWVATFCLTLLLFFCIFSTFSF